MKKYHINVGKDNWNWKGGFSNCIDCGKKLKTYGAKRCSSCAKKYLYKIYPNSHPMVGKRGWFCLNSKEIGSMHLQGRYLAIKIAVNKWIYYHIYKVEKYIGRKLKKKELIHHIDGNPLNNKLDNLYIFTKRGIHSSFEVLIHSNIISRFILKSNLKQIKKKKKV